MILPHFAAGLLAGLLSACAFLPYIRDTWAHRTRPERASWFIWSVLSTLALVSQAYEGRGPSLWFCTVQAGATILIFLLSIRLGSGGLMKPADRVVLVAAGCGLVLWYLTDNAGWTLALTIVIGSLGGSVTVAKAYLRPGTETLSTWVLSTIASALAIYSVGRPDPMLVAYPAYLMCLYAAITAALLLGRRRAHATRSPASMNSL